MYIRSITKMAAEVEVKTDPDEHFEWNVENEIHLFEAMIGYKPVGVHKHFHMACICEKFETLLGKPVSPDIIWNHLRDMYDLAALDKKEITTFPNEEVEFTLPEPDFSELIAQKITKSEVTNEVSIKEEKLKDEKPPKMSKETTQGNGNTKKEKKVELEESSVDVEKKEIEESETPELKKGKVKKEEKPVGKRGKRSLKDKKTDEESPQVTAPIVKKAEEDSSTPQSSNQKGKRIIGKRSLRSRADDAGSKSSTPPPMKRARRI